MIEEQATVLAVNGDQVSIEISRQSGCGHCSAKNTCGTSILDRFFNRNKNQMVLQSDLDISVGDEVIVGIEEGSLVKGSFIVYTLPLISMLVFPVVASGFTSSEAVSIFSALTGFIAGLFYVRYFSRQVQNDERYRPVILRQLSNSRMYAGCVTDSQELL